MDEEHRRLAEYSGLPVRTSNLLPYGMVALINDHTGRYVVFSTAEKPTWVGPGPDLGTTSSAAYQGHEA